MSTGTTAFLIVAAALIGLICGLNAGGSIWENEFCHGRKTMVLCKDKSIQIGVLKEFTND